MSLTLRAVTRSCTTALALKMMRKLKTMENYCCRSEREIVLLNRTQKSSVGIYGAAEVEVQKIWDSDNRDKDLISLIVQTDQRKAMPMEAREKRQMDRKKAIRIGHNRQLVISSWLPSEMSYSLQNNRAGHSVTFTCSYQSKPGCCS